MQRKKRSIIWKIDKKELSIIVSRSKSISEVLRYFDLNATGGGNNKTLKQRLLKDNICFKHIPQV